jgi:hypothetical protein
VRRFRAGPLTGLVAQMPADHLSALLARAWVTADVASRILI